MLYHFSSIHTPVHIGKVRISAAWYVYKYMIPAGSGDARSVPLIKLIRPPPGVQVGMRGHQRLGTMSAPAIHFTIIAQCFRRGSVLRLFQVVQCREKDHRDAAEVKRD